MARLRMGYLLRRGSNLADLIDKAAARLNLGLGTAATANTGAGNGLDADTLDGAQRSALLEKHIGQDTNRTGMGSGSPPNIASIASSGNADNVALTIDNRGNGSASAVMQFHRLGSFAAYFGLDVDGRWKVGGRSMGAVAYELWHDGNKAAKLGALGVDDIGSTRFFCSDNASFSTGQVVSAGSIGASAGSWLCTGFYVGISGGSADLGTFRRIS